MKRDSKPVNFSAPHVAAGLSNDPIAERTRAAMAARGRTTYSAPVGGQHPPIPRLDMPADEGSTMADQARGQRLPPPGPAVAAAGSFVNRQSAPADNTFRPPTPPRTGPQLHPSDILPEMARQDPAFMEGAGSMYAQSQPELAMKYGVIRNKQHIPAQQLMAGATPGKLSPATVAGLEAVAAFQKTREKAESGDATVEAASAAGPAGQAARMGQTSDEKPLTDEERARMNNVAKSMDDFDWHTLREMMLKDVLNNEEQKKLIEGRLKPMDLGDYVSNGFVEQDVPVNSKLEYTFRSTDGQTDLALKRLVVKEAKGFALDDRYILDKYAIMAMACGLQRINKIPLPDYQDANGDFNDEKFWIKFNKVTRLGLHILASVGINNFWFDIRVRKLLVAEAMGNG